MAKRHFLAGYHMKITGGEPEPTEVMARLMEFANHSKEKPPLDLPDAQRVLKIQEFSINGLSAEAVLLTGDYGVECPMINVSTGRHAHDRKKEEADTYPLHAVLDLSVTVPGPLAVFHRYGRQGVRTSFEIKLNEFLEERKCGFRVHFTPVAPAIVVKEWMKTGRATHLIFHKRQAGLSKVGQLGVVQSRMAPESSGKRRRQPPEPAIDRTLTIQVRWGHWAMEKIRTLLGKSDVDPRSIAELVDAADFEPDSVDVVFDSESGRSKKYTVGGKFTMTEDVDAEIPKASRQPAVSAAVFKAARSYLVRLSS